MKEGKVVLVTGATGKVGQNLIRRFVADPAWQDAKIRAFCHNRLLEEGERLEVVQGSMAERGDVARAVAGTCLLYTSPSPRDGLLSRKPSSA